MSRLVRVLDWLFFLLALAFVGEQAWGLVGWLTTDVPQSSRYAAGSAISVLLFVFMAGVLRGKVR